DQAIYHEVFGAPPKRSATFYMHARKDECASGEAGFPVYRDVPYCTIRLKGERDFVSNEATDAHRAEFPQAWHHFERTLAWDQHGIEMLPRIPPSAVATLKELGVHTIERLADVDVPAPMAQWRELAQRWVRFWANPKPRLRV